MIKAVIFDLDGTLADTLDDITTGLNGMLDQYGFPTVTRAQTLSNINNGAFELVRRSLPENKRSDEFVTQAKKVYESYYSGCYCDKTHEYQGCTEILQTLNQKGISLSVLSNKQDVFVKKIIEKLFSDVKFDFVIGQGPFPTKPNPEAVNYIVNKLGIDKNAVAFIGDSNVDIITAINSDVTPIGVSWGYRPPSILEQCGARAIINTPSQLFDVLNILI